MGTGSIGIGTSFPIRRWTMLNMIKELTVIIDGLNARLAALEAQWEQLVSYEKCLYHFCKDIF